MAGKEERGKKVGGAVTGKNGQEIRGLELRHPRNSKPRVAPICLHLQAGLLPGLLPWQLQTHISLLPSALQLPPRTLLAGTSALSPVANMADLWLLLETK